MLRSYWQVSGAPSQDFNSAKTGHSDRNGGHASPIIYNEYEDLKNDYGVTVAQQILRFRIAHINGLVEVAKQEDLLSESQARIVEDYDVFLHPAPFEKAKSQLDMYLKEVPEDMKEYFSVIQERGDIDVSIQDLRFNCLKAHCVFRDGNSRRPRQG